MEEVYHTIKNSSFQSGQADCDCVYDKTLITLESTNGFSKSKSVLESSKVAAVERGSLKSSWIIFLLKFSLERFFQFLENML